MATNDFQVFAGGAGANVLAQSDWLALAALGSGFSAGVAQSAACNKAWRQSSIMASVLAQFIVANTGQNATDDGTTATLLANLQKAVGGRLLNIQVFTSSGTYTPTPGTNSIEVECLGGGGGGNATVAPSSAQISVGSGGASGSYARSRYTSGFSSGVAVTVGAGGTGGVAGGAAAQSGGTSSFGALLVCPGGGAPASTGGAITPPLVGTGGVGSPGASPSGSGIVVSFPGQAGMTGFGLAVNSGISGAGANSMYGSGGPSVYASANSPGRAATGFGAGGGGAATLSSGSAQTGGSGTPGIIIVKEYA